MSLWVGSARGPPPKAHQQCGGYLLLCTYLDEVGSCLETPPRSALAGSGLCEGKHVRARGGGGEQPSALSPAPTVTGWPRTPLPEAQTGQCSGLLYPGLRPLGRGQSKQLLRSKHLSGAGKALT